MNIIDSIDSIELDSRDGFDIRAELVPDDHYYDGPDGDSYGEKQIAAWRAGDWYYVGIIVTASRNGIDLGSDSIWAVENGHFPTDDGWVWIDALRDEDATDCYFPDLIDNAVADARMTLANLADAAIDASMGGN